jgi:dTDP-4-dehydrorhamnose reductase
MILVTGSKGQLGLSLQKILDKNRTIFTDTDQLDVTNYEAVEKFIGENDVHTVVNCAAYTAVNAAENDADAAYRVNALGAKHLAVAANAHKASVIQISTDYVFDGNNFKPYTENDQPNPVSIYGQTKLEGELFVLKNSDNCVVLRTSWLYSEYGTNFVKTIIANARGQKELKVVYDQIGSPTYAGDLARIIEGFIPVLKNGIKQIYNYSSEGVCSWYGFARAIVSFKQIDCEVLPVESQEYPSAARRPHYSVLSKAKIKKDFGIKIPYWRDGLKKAIVNID